jgi:hypothetical protein
MAESEEARPEDVRTSAPRLFWTVTALAMVAMLLLCSALVLVAATRG